MRAEHFYVQYVPAQNRKIMGKFSMKIGKEEEKDDGSIYIEAKQLHNITITLSEMAENLNILKMTLIRFLCSRGLGSEVKRKMHSSYSPRYFFFLRLNLLFPYCLPR